MQPTVDPGVGTLDMMPTLKQILVVYGPLGIFAIVVGLVARSLYRDLKAERLAHTAALKAKDDAHTVVIAAQHVAFQAQYAAFTQQLKLERDACETERKQHADELDKLRDRYIEKADTWVTKWAENNAAQSRVIESALKPRVGGI